MGRNGRYNSSSTFRKLFTEGTGGLTEHLPCPGSCSHICGRSEIGDGVLGRQASIIQYSSWSSWGCFFDFRTNFFTHISSYHQLQTVLLTTAVYAYL